MPSAPTYVELHCHSGSMEFARSAREADTQADVSGVRALVHPMLSRLSRERQLSSGPTRLIGSPPFKDAYPDAYPYGA